VVDLLDGLCDRMQDYTLQKVSLVVVYLLPLCCSTSIIFLKFSGIIYHSDHCKLTNEILIATLLQVESKNRQWVKVGSFDNLTSNAYSLSF